MRTDPSPGWTAASEQGRGVDVTVLGLRVSLRTRTPGQAEQIQREWSRCLSSAAESSPQVGSTDAPSGDRADRLVVDSHLPLTQPMRHRLTANLTEAGVEHLAGRALMLHAAGLAADDGAVLVLVAESGAGKSTAATRLCREHFGYVTDETTAILPSGQVLGFPKPLSLVDTGALDGSKVTVSPDDLGLRHHPADLRLGRVVLLDRRPGLATGSASLSALTLAEGITALIPHTSALPRLPAPITTMARLLDRCGPVHRLGYRDIDGAAELLRGHLAAPAPEPAEWSPLPIAGPAGPGHGYLSVAPADGIIVDGEAVMLVGDRPIRLFGLGLTLWTRALGAWTARDELVEACITIHGPHSESRDIVGGAIDQLIALGLMRYDDH